MRRTGKARGVTLIEVLATVLLVAIVVPAVANAIVAAQEMASQTRRRTEATSLAEAKLNELVVTGDWQSGATRGDFGQDFPLYQWDAAVSTWEEQGLQQLDVRVQWMYGSSVREVTVSTLVYVPETATSAGGGQ